MKHRDAFYYILILIAVCCWGVSFVFTTGTFQLCEMTPVALMFFLFMVFAALSTVLGVLENILAMVREVTGWSRAKGSIVCGVALAILATTTALGYSVFHFQPFAEGTAWLDFWDFIVSTNLLPLGALCYALFCCYKKLGWGWDELLAEANAGEGMKVKNWMKPIFKYVVPVAVIGLYIYGLITFAWH